MGTSTECLVLENMSYTVVLKQAYSSFTVQNITYTHFLKEKEKNLNSFCHFNRYHFIVLR